MSDPAPEVEAIRKGLDDGSLLPQVAMQRLVALMRTNPTLPGAKELYQEASRKAYGTGRSSLAHSHPPPPATDDDD